MSDALTPLRHAYGFDPPGDPAAPGDAGHAEQEALRQLRAALDAWPVPSPADAAVAAVEGRAAVVSAAVHTTDAAVAHAFAGRPQPRPSAAAVAAVLAAAAEVVPSASPVEAAVLAQSREALGRLPAQRPSAAAVASIEAYAAQATAVEAATLDPMRTALGRAFAGRPQPRPSADAVAAVLARAAEPTAADEIPAASPVEGAVLAQSLRALDRLPRPRPSAAALDALRVAAAAATAAATPAAPAPAPALPFYRRTPVWGAAALVMAAVVAAVVLPFGGLATETAVPLADAVEVADAAPAEEIAAPPVEAVAPPPPSVPRAASAAGSIAGSGLVAAAERRPVAARPAAARPSAPTAVKPLVQRASASDLAASRPAPPADATTWETSDDVRMLSLRLSELDEADALAWDDAPAEAFGVPASAAGGTAGVQAVRAGAPARARLRPDSTSANR